MEPRPAYLVLLLLLQVVEATNQMAQDCRVYHLQNGTQQRPAVPFLGQLEVSLWMGEAGGGGGGIPNDLAIHLTSDHHLQNQTVQVFINRDCEALVLVKDKQVGRMLRLVAAHSDTWLTLVLTYHHGTLLLYRPENRMNMVRAAITMEGNMTATVHSSNELHFAFNCGVGCLVHDGSSPLMGVSLGLGPSLGLYLSPQPGARHPAFVLSPTSNQSLAPADDDVPLNTTWWQPGTWYKLVPHDQEGDGRVRGSREEVQIVKIPLMNVSYSITHSIDVLWTLHCYPDMARGVEKQPLGETSTPQPPTKDIHNQRQTEHESAGAGEVVAWILAALALFVVALLALALCTRMSPPPDRPPDFLPSVGVVSQRFEVAENGREAEEESEPGSPMLTVPPVSHRLPQSVDYSTKVL